VRRRFSGSERAALWLAADGKCTRCGVQLEPGWHADHRHPYSLGGATDVVNGDALCPACNLKKGNTVNDLRPWQTKALHTFQNTAGGDFLLVATPGAGKTRFSLECMSGEGEFFIVVVPTSRLRLQWADAAADFRLNLDPRFENNLADPPADCHGVVVTYQSVSAAPHVYRRLSDKHRTFVVLDEIHHCGESDNLAWGKAVQYAFEPAARRLLLSGTPFRRDSNPIPFVRYEGAPPKSQADYSYDYRLALRDGAVRPVEFACWNGTARWVEAGEVRESGLDDVARVDEGKALISALMVESDWMGAVLPEAHRRLSAIRRDVPDAGGLIVANTQHAARSVAAALAKVTGHEVPVAVCDDPKAREVIERFTVSSDPWLVAVNMVSEGVDIPRLMVGVYATLSRSEMFFRQVVGRFVRVRGDESDSYPATVFLPSVPTLVTLAREIEQERDHELAAVPDRERKDGVTQQEFELWDPMAALDGRPLGTVLDGVLFSDDELRRADDLMCQAGMTNASPAQVARLLRLAGMGRVVGKAVVENRADFRDKEALRADVNQLVKKVARRTGEEHGHIWVRLHDGVGAQPPKIAHYTTEQLRQAVETLARWLDE
jgi:superfamily II DNA or RNA helicase